MSKLKESETGIPRTQWTVVAISNVPWFATAVEGAFGVGTGGIFATIVRVVQAFVWVWVIIKVNIKSILPEQTGCQYSHQYNIIIYYIII